VTRASCLRFDRRRGAARSGTWPWPGRPGVYREPPSSMLERGDRQGLSCTPYELTIGARRSGGRDVPGPLRRARRLSELLAEGCGFDPDHVPTAHRAATRSSATGRRGEKLDLGEGSTAHSVSRGEFGTGHPECSAGAWT
jgi:hypothetical protein